MHTFKELTHFVGFDWASDHHDVVVIGSTGNIVAQFRFDHTADGWHLFREKLAPYPAVGVVIETSSGIVVDRLMDAEFNVYPINPRSAKAYRIRKAPSGVKDDKLDAWAIGDALRMEGHSWRALKPEDPLTMELRLVCRDEVDLIQERTAKVNQLRTALREYYPAALEAFDDFTKQAAQNFVIQFPTPAALQKAGRRKWEKFLHANRGAHPKTYEKRLEIFARAHTFSGSKAMTLAKSRLAVTLAKLLRTLKAQLQEYREHIQRLFDQHPDREWFGTLPVSAVGKTLPRVLAELGTDRERFENAHSFQRYGGSAPVSYKSGKIHKVYIRKGCNHYLRYAMHWYADLSRRKCPWAQIYYQRKREEGMTHSCALRCLAQRWYKIIEQMWRHRRPYDPEYHLRNQIRHGSWMVDLIQTRMTVNSDS